MSDFTILRFHECSDRILGQLKRSRFWLVFWTAAVILLFLNLGLSPAMRSESCWLVAAREMLQSGDWLHPTINGHAYFDSAQASCWFICLASLFFGGNVSEFAARVPSAIAGIIALISLISLCRTLFRENAARFSACAMLTALGFLYWARLAEAGMENMTFILASTALYMKFRTKKSFFAYFLFWLLCAAGALTKGIPALITPLLLAALDLFLRKDWKTHLNWKFFLAAMIGLGIYVLPFIPDVFSRDPAVANGLHSAMRKNGVCIIGPWDHTHDPFRNYVFSLPLLLLPWSVFFLLAFCSSTGRIFRNWKSAPCSEKWLWLSSVLLFCTYGAARFRGTDCMLPLLPFCIIMTGDFLTRTDTPGVFSKIANGLLAVLKWLPTAAGLVCLAMPLIFRKWIAEIVLPSDLSNLPVWFVPALDILLPACGILILLFTLMAHRKKWDALPGGKNWSALGPFLWFSCCLVFCLALPLFRSEAAFQSGKTFIRSMAAKSAALGIPMTGSALLNIKNPDVIYYLNLKKGERLKSFSCLAPKANEGICLEQPDLQQLQIFVRNAKQNGGMIFGQFQDVKKLPPDLRAEFMFPGDNVTILPDQVEIEPFTMWEQCAIEKDPKNFQTIINEKIIVRYFTTSNEEMKQ